MARQKYVSAHQNQHKVKFRKRHHKKNGFSYICGIQQYNNKQINKNPNKDEESNHFSSLMSGLASDHTMASEDPDIFRAYDIVSEYFY